MGDSIDGGAGTDSLTAEIKSSVTPIGIRNIETVTLLGSAAATVDFTNANAIATLNSAGATGGAMTLQGFGKVVNVNISDTAQNHTVTYNDVTGAADSATIGLANVSAGTLTVAGIETLTLNVTGTASTLTTLTTADATQLTVTGSKGLTITNDLDATILVVDASAATGAVDIDMGAGTVTVTGGSGNDIFELSASGNASVTGGDGNDTFQFASGAFSTFTSADTVAGGAGTDTLTVDTLTAITDTDLTTLNLTGSGAITITTLNAVPVGIINAGTMTAAVTVSAVNTTNNVVITGSTTIGSNLTGGIGADSITGGSGVDTITGGVGADTLVGGSAADSFVVVAADTGVFTAGLTTTTAATMDKYYVAAGDFINVAGIVATDAWYDGFATLVTSNVTALPTAITASTGDTNANAIRIQGNYNATTDVFTAGSSNANAVLLAFAATDAGTTITDSIILVGVTDVTSMANGVITV